MANHSGDFARFASQDDLQASSSALQDLRDLARWGSVGLYPALEPTTGRTSASPCHGQSMVDAPWQGDEPDLMNASCLEDESQYHASRGDGPPAYIPEPATNSPRCVNPQDTIFTPEYSTVREWSGLQEVQHGVEQDPIWVDNAAGESGTAECELPQGHGRETTNTVEPTPKKQRRARLPREATSQFKTWFREHSAYPYPSHDEVTSLAQQTQTTAKQVKAWFNNARTRFKHSPVSDTADGITIPNHHGLTTSALETWSKTSGSPRSLDSIKRYLALPSVDGDPTDAPPSSCLTAPSTTDQDDAASSHADEVPAYLGGSVGQQPSSTAQYISESDHHSVFSGLSLASMGSALSGQTSFTSASASGGSRRRGKRRFDHLDSDTSLTCKKFPCTFCRKTFASAYDWKRHEATHLPFVAQWICMPDASPIDEDGDCRFCFAPGVDEAHAQAMHGVDSCLRRPLEARTFGRKDQLKQHIELCHLTRSQKADSHMLNKFLDHWRRDVELDWRNDEHKEALWCGFCCTHSHTWKERQEHVLEHLRGGNGLSRWHSYGTFIAYCEDKWDERHAASFKMYSQYVDHLIARLKAETKEDAV